MSHTASWIFDERSLELFKSQQGLDTQLFGLKSDRLWSARYMLSKYGASICGVIHMLDKDTGLTLKCQYFKDLLVWKVHFFYSLRYCQFWKNLEKKQDQEILEYGISKDGIPYFISCAFINKLMWIFLQDRNQCPTCIGASVMPNMDRSAGFYREKHPTCYSSTL